MVQQTSIAGALSRGQAAALKQLWLAASQSWDGRTAPWPPSNQAGQTGQSHAETVSEKAAIDKQHPQLRPVTFVLTDSGIQLHCM